jgi:hypothetical protein
MIGDGHGRRNESHLVDELVANDPAKRLEIEFAAHRQCPRQIVMADEGRAKSIERRVTEDVIRMLVRIDDIQDRLIGAGADSGQQPLADRHAAAGVDDGNPLVADHEADIGDIAQVLFAHQGDFAGMDEYARRDFLDRQRSEGLAAESASREEGDSGDEQSAEQPAHVPIRNFLTQHSSGRRRRATTDRLRQQRPRCDSPRRRFAQG